MKLSLWSVPVTRTFQVKVKPLRLEGFDDNKNGEYDVAIKMKWKRESKIGLLPFHRKSMHGKDFTSAKVVRKGLAIEWDDEFENTCSFAVVANGDQKFRPCFLSFAILYGDQKMVSAAKMAVIGKVSLNIAEVASKMAAQVERKLPVKLQVAGNAIEATLVVHLSFVEIRGSRDSIPIAVDSINSGELSNSDESAAFDREDAAGASLATHLRSSASPEAQLNLEKKVGFFSWKRRRLSFKPEGAKVEPLFKKSSSYSNQNDVNSLTFGSIQKETPFEASSKWEYQNEDSLTAAWETKELVSRDGRTKLKASMFFASFDQRSEKAAGESACSVLATVISHWLQSNRYTMPTRSEFNNLIIEGSAEWRKLCETDAYVNNFPNKHFDLETVIRAHIRPVSIAPDQSFIGFFSPEKFDCLKGVSSFDEIWEKISRNTESYEPKVYIISWNDHFFVLKAEADAYYIIDTLGERLSEGCNQAYILRFDEWTVMYADMVEGEGEKGDEKEMICSGKESCKEFIKRFLAAIPLKELEEEEEKKSVSYFSLHHRLQIEFNYSYLLSSASSTSSPFSSSSSSTSPL